MAFRTAMNSRVPMVIILGATGTGKTKLSLELAQKFATEIISADSMQVYKGLDIVTAKATKQERSCAPHHLLDLLEPHQSFTVVDFRNRALKLIDKLIEKEKIPIIVGGTNYYIESIVYRILVEDHNDADDLLWEQKDNTRKRRPIDCSDNKVTAKKQHLDESLTSNDEKIGSTSKVKENASDLKFDKLKIIEILENEAKYTNEEFHGQLKAVDPVMAGRLHPNNRRKVFRSLEVLVKNGRRHSDILAEQLLTEGQLRRPGSTVIFWLQCEQKIHDERLDARVDAMLREGLIAELLDFHRRHNLKRIEDGQPPDYTKGVYQTLGFKEFHDYLMLTEEERDSERGKNLLLYSIENMKMATRRYARRQKKMVLARFLNHPIRETPALYELDTTDITKWDENVKNKAIAIIESFCNSVPCEYEPLKPCINEEMKSTDGNSANFCDVCQRIIIGDNTYKIHLNSNKHNRMVKKLNKANESQK